MPHELVHPIREAQGEPEREGGVGHHVHHRGASRQRTMLDAQMAAVARVVHGTIPGPHRAVMETQSVERGQLSRVRASRRDPAPRVTGEHHLVIEHSCHERLERALDPAAPERDARTSALVLLRAPLGPHVHGLLEQRDSGFLPQAMLGKEGRVAGHGEHGAAVS